MFMLRVVELIVNDKCKNHMVPNIYWQASGDNQSFGRHLCAIFFDAITTEASS